MIDVTPCPLRNTTWWEKQQVVLIIFHVLQAPAHGPSGGQSERVVTFVDAAGTELVPNGVRAALGTLLRALVPATWHDGSILSLQDVDLWVPGFGGFDTIRYSVLASVYEDQDDDDATDSGMRIMVKRVSAPLRITFEWNDTDDVHETPTRYFQPSDTLMDMYRHCDVPPCSWDLLWDGRNLTTQSALRSTLAQLALPPECTLVVARAATGSRMMVTVKKLSGQSIGFSVMPMWLVCDLKMQVMEKEGIPEDQQRLIFAGKQMEDGSTLASNGIRHRSTVHLVLRLSGC
eukprot:TRINITY_DN896_c0_g2_i1.p1 TRINITY_DN896_c0_g2~~TRINITY_DN896_c0_g2_i1.p1  ORF type:complete len:289 (+),score=73.88 TRINITY_DN896_c0_g2_i1:894-1760(+)